MSKKTEKTLTKRPFKERAEEFFDKIKRIVGNAFYDLTISIRKLLKLNKKQGSDVPKKTVKNKNFGRNMFLFLVLLLPMINFIIFYIFVNFNSILLAFEQYDSVTGKYSLIGLKNFKDFIFDLGNSYFMPFATKNSFTLYLIGQFVSMPLQVFCSYFIYKKIPLSGFFKVVLYLPQIISGIVMTIMYKYFMDVAVPEVFSMLGFKKPDFFSTTNAFKTIIGFGIWFGLGGGMIIYTGAMSRIPEELVEYGLLEGITMMKEFIFVTIPLIFPTLSVYIITGFSGIFTNQGSIYTFFGENADPALYTYGYYMFIKVVGEKASLAQYPYASAAGLLFTVAVAPLTLLLKYLLEKFGPSVEF